MGTFVTPPGQDRCGAGLTCVAEGTIPYSSYEQYKKLTGSPSDYAKTSDPGVMGTCRKLTTADCGKLWRPCGGAAEKLGCSGDALNCAADAFCASPGDTRLGAPRCLPVPPRCGTVGAACCPGNAGGTVRERWYVDKKTPVPTCNDGKSMCVWSYDDYRDYGTGQFPDSPGEWWSRSLPAFAAASIRSLQQLWSRAGLLGAS